MFHPILDGRLRAGVRIHESLSGRRIVLHLAARQAEPILPGQHLDRERRFHPNLTAESQWGQLRARPGYYIARGQLRIPG